MKELPEFRARPYELVLAFATRAFTIGQRAEESYLRRLIAYEDGHYRALFAPSYFLLADGRKEPTKSQWNTLKKHLKRIDPLVFTFKDYGSAWCEDDQTETCLYLDFGFFAEMPER